MNLLDRAMKELLHYGMIKSSTEDKVNNSREYIIEYETNIYYVYMHNGKVLKIETR